MKRLRLLLLSVVVITLRAASPMAPLVLTGMDTEFQRVWA